MTTTAPAVLTEVDTVDEQGEAILVILKMLTIVSSFNNVGYVDKGKIEKYVFLEIVQIRGGGLNVLALVVVVVISFHSTQKFPLIFSPRCHKVI